MTEPGGVAEVRRRYRRQQAALAAEVAALVTALWQQVDPANVDANWPLVLAALKQAIRAGHVRSTAAGAQFVAEHAALYGAPIRVAPVPPLPDDQLDTSLRVTGPVAVKIAARAGMDAEAAGRAALVQLVGSSTRLVRAGGRAAVVRSATRYASGWARVASPNCCDWCQMLASRGAVYRTAETAGAGYDWHDHCVCEPEPVYEAR